MDNAGTTVHVFNWGLQKLGGTLTGSEKALNLHECLHPEKRETSASVK